MISKNDKDVMTDLAKRVSEIASKDIMDYRRDLWASHNALNKVRTPIYIRDGGWSNEVVKPNLKCENEFLRGHELFLRKMIIQEEINDDYVIEPFIKLISTKILPGEGPWGVMYKIHDSGFDSGAKKFDKVVENLHDLSILKVPNHQVDEFDTNINYEMLNEAVGGNIEVSIDRTPLWWGFEADISTRLGYIRGLEQIMWDMYDDPVGLKNLLSFMRDGILKTQKQAEEQKHLSLTSHINQSMCYIDGLEGPKANSKPVKMNQLWGFSAAQEFALISPEMHDEFMFEYQIPIMEKFKYVSYGCCEDLSKKIDMIRKLKNIRRVAISPYSDERECAEQLQDEYVASWRPDPATTVCLDFEPKRVENILRKADKAYKDNNCVYDICLKDIHTIQGDFSRLVDFVKIARNVVED